MPAFSIDKPSMELLTQFIDIVLHLDKHLAILVQQYGLWIYGILFFIIFAETGFVIFPFRPRLLALSWPVRWLPSARAA